MLTFRFRFLCI